MASPPTMQNGFRVAPCPSGQGACVADRPTSTRLESAWTLRGVNHRFTFVTPFRHRLPDPGRLAVPTRPDVVRAAPTLPCASRIRLPSASPGCCDSPTAGLIPLGTSVLRGALHPMSTQLHPRMPTSPSPARRPGFATVSRSAPEGRRTPVHRCGREMYRSGRTEGDVQNRRPGGLDARLDASLRADHRRHPRVRCESSTVGACATVTACPHQSSPMRRGGRANTQLADPGSARPSGPARGVAIVFGP